MASYDIKLVQGATTLNYMLVKTDNKKLWNVSDAPLLPPTLVTGDFTPSSISPDRAIRLSQDDWRKGFQDLMLDDPKKYYQSKNCDARFKGQVILSPKELGALAAPSTGKKAIKDAGMEDWVDAGNLTYWTKMGGGTLIQDTDKYTGTYAAKLKGLSTNIEIYQDLPFHSQNKGKQFTLKAYCKITTDIDSAKIGIDDGVGTTWSSEITNTTYTQISVSRTLNANATRLRIRFYAAEAASFTAYLWVDAVTVESATPNLGSCAKEINFGSDVLIASGPSLLKVSGSSLVVITDFPATITDLCVYDNKLFIALGLSNAFYYTSDLSTFTQSNLIYSTAKYMSNIGGFQFWITDTNNTLRDSDNPINNGTPFSTPYTLPNSAYSITGLVDDDAIVYVRKQDQVYYLSGAKVYSLIPELAAEVNTIFSYGIYPWKGKLYLPSGVNSLYEYDDGVVTVLSPTRYAVGDPNFDTKILALAGDETYLYVVIENGIQIEVLAGRWEYVDGVTDWVWHPIYEKTCNDITAALISSVTGYKRLYLGTNTASDGIFNFIVPVAYAEVLKESGYKVIDGGDFITPWFRGNFPTEKKYWESVDVINKCITARTYIIIYYQKKGDTTWTSLGTCTPQALVNGDYPPEITDTKNINISSERIRFKFTLVTTDENYSPILYGKGGGYGISAKLQSTRKKAIEATILVAPYWRERDGTVISRTISTDLTALRTLYTSTALITLTGPEATAYSVLFDREGYREELAYDETGRIENYWVSVKLLEV